MGAYNDSIADTDANNWVVTDPLLIVSGGTTPSNLKNMMVILKKGKTGFGTNTPLGLQHVKRNSQLTNP